MSSFEQIEFNVNSSESTYTGEVSDKHNAVANYVLEEFGPGRYFAEVRGGGLSYYLFDSDRMFIDRLTLEEADS